MNDISILIWNILFIASSIHLWVVYSDVAARNFNSFYQGIWVCTKLFLQSFILFFSAVVRAFLWTDYIVRDYYDTFISVLNAAISWLPLVDIFILFLCSSISFVLEYSGYYDHASETTFCSLRTLKLINSFSEIQTNSFVFFYKPKNGSYIEVYFSPVVLALVCYGFCKEEKEKRKNRGKKNKINKEKVLYETLISDLQKIKKENEAEASKYFDKAKETFKNIK